jgi:hypothetical protein
MFGRHPACDWLLALLLVLAQPVSVVAQSGTSPEADRLVKLFGQRPVEGFSLLLDPRVQRDLKLERAQMLRIVARDQAALALIETATPPPEPKDIPALTKRQEEFREQVIAQVLTDSQRKRLHQLLAQQQGASLLLKKEMELELRLSDTQRYVLYSIHQETIKKVQALPGGAANKAKLRQLRLAGFNHMLRALTDEQRKKFRAFLGPPVDLG